MKAKWVQKGKCASIHGTKTTKAVFEGLTEKGILSAFSSAIKKPQIMPPLWCVVKLTNTQQNSLNGTVNATNKRKWLSKLNCHMSWAVWVRGGGSTPGNSCWGVPPASSNPDPNFKPKKCNFQTRPLYPYPFSDLAFRQKLCYHYLD